MSLFRRRTDAPWTTVGHRLAGRACHVVRALSSRDQAGSAPALARAVAGGEGGDGAGGGRFRPAAEVVRWVAEHFGVGYTVSGMHQLLRRLRCKPKVPRPLAEKADLAAQEAWKKGGV